MDLSNSLLGFRKDEQRLHASGVEASPYVGKRSISTFFVEALQVGDSVLCSPALILCTYFPSPLRSDLAQMSLLFNYFRRMVPYVCLVTIMYNLGARKLQKFPSFASFRKTCVYLPPLSGPFQHYPKEVGKADVLLGYYYVCCIIERSCTCSYLRRRPDDIINEGSLCEVD